MEWLIRQILHLPERVQREMMVLGRVQLAPEVLEVIIGIATNEVEGVANTRGNFATGVAEKFGKVIHGKGVKTDWSEDGLIDRCILCCPIWLLGTCSSYGNPKTNSSYSIQYDFT